MFQIDQATAVSSLPAPSSAGTQGFFTNGNPVGGQPATVVDADFMNMIMMELVNVVAASGQTLSKTTYNQVLLAIKRLVQSQATLTDSGAANAYAAANNPPLVSGANATWVNGVMQQLVVAHTNTGASTYAPDGLTAIPIYGSALQPLQGGEMIAGGTAFLMKQTITGVNGGNPIAVLLGCSGGAQQIPPATSSQHAVQLGQLTNAGVVPGRLITSTTFSASGTWTPNSKTTTIRVRMLGGSGGGGGSSACTSAQASAGGGGGGGAYHEILITNPGAQTVTIGAAGTAGAAGNNAGGNGGTTSFGLIASAGGGGGGGGGPAWSSFPVNAAQGGTAGTVTPISGTVIASPGNPGCPGIVFGLTSMQGGQGATAIYGGAASYSNGSAGFAATGPGAGGGGASTAANGSAVPGGAGFHGELIVDEFS
jgi:hypothetical protein